MRENRQLTKQLDTWKQQLASFDSSSGNVVVDHDVYDDYDEEDLDNMDGGANFEDYGFEENWN